MLSSGLIALTLIFPSRALTLPNTTVVRRGPHPVPHVDGSISAGWQSMPTVDDAITHPNWDIGGASIPLYLSANRDTSRIKRAVIINSGLPRDCWASWTYANNGLYASNVDRDTVSIMAPCWFAPQDVSAGASPPDTLVYEAGKWMGGDADVVSSEFSSFRVLDALVAYYTDLTRFPDLEVLTIAGHSSGGQFTQRYALLRAANTQRIQFWVANPASFAWLTIERPVLVIPQLCTHVDDFKYGLSGVFPEYVSAEVDALGRRGLVERYRARTVQYAFGTADRVAEDTGCQAMAQGAYHLARGRNFVRMLEGMEGGMPRTQGVDYVDGVAHSDEGMIESDSAKRTFFGAA